MPNDNDSVLINVEIKAQQALEELAALQQKVRELRKEQKSLDTSTEEGRKAYAMLGEQIKALNKQAQERSKAIQNEIKQQNELDGSLQQLKAKLSSLTQEYNKLSQAQREDEAVGGKLRQQISETNDALLDAETAVGNFHRQVGNYNVVVEGLADNIEKMTDKLFEMRMAGEGGTEAYKEMLAELVKMRKTMKEVDTEVENLTSNTRALDTLADAVSFGASAWGLYESAVTVAGGTTEEMHEAMLKIQQVTLAVNSLIEISNHLRKTGNLYKASEIALEKTHIKSLLASAAAYAGEAAAKKAGTAASVAWTVAQKALNKVMAMNPVLLVAGAVGALAVGIYSLVKALGSSEDAYESAQKAMENYKKEAERLEGLTQDAADAEELAAAKIRLNTEKEIKAMREAGATEEEIAARRSKMDEELAANSKAHSKERIKTAQDEANAAIRNYNKIAQSYNQMARDGDTSGEEWEETKKMLAEARQVMNDKRIEFTNIQEEYTRKENELAEKRKQQREEELQAMQDNYQKRVDTERETTDTLYEIRREGERKRMEQSGASSLELLSFDQQTQAQLLANRQKADKKVLEWQRKHGTITLEEYKQALKDMEAETERFNTENNAKMREAVMTEYEAVLDFLKPIEEKKIEETDAIFKSRKKAVENQIALWQEELKKLEAKGVGDGDQRVRELKNSLMNGWIAYDALAEEHEKAITDIKAEEEKKRLAETLQAIMDGNEEELAEMARTEKEKTEMAVEAAKKRAEAAKKSEEEAETAEGKENAQDERIKAEREMYDEMAKLRKMNLAEELADAKGNAKKIEEAFKEYQNDIIKNLDEMLSKGLISQELHDQLVADVKNWEPPVDDWTDKLEKFQKYVSNIGGAISDIFSEVNDMMSAQEDEQMKQYEKNNEAKKERLQERLDAGLISQEDYNDQVAAMDEELAQKQAELELKQAKRDKALALFNAIINTALSISNALGSLPPPLSFIMAGLSAALGAVQIAAIASEPLPEAARGALLVGPSHAQGGIPIEAEGGEAIINKHSTKAFLPLLSAINVAGGGVPLFARGGIAGDLAVQDMAVDAMTQQIQSQPIYVAVTDINKGQSNMARVVSHKKF